jgi:hypothetical protein
MSNTLRNIIAGPLVNRSAVIQSLKDASLSDSEIECFVEQGILTTADIEKANRDGQALARPAEGLSSITSYVTASEILMNGFLWKANSLATGFMKARDAVIKNKHPQLLEEKKQASREARDTFASFIGVTGCQIDADEVVMQYCGFGRVWTSPDKRIAALAEEHGISMERARELSEAGSAAAQDYVQRQRGNLAGVYLGWLADVTPHTDETAECTVAIAECIVQAYAKAGEWTNRAEGLLIEDAANEFGVILPKWADVLPKITQVTIKQKEAVERRIGQQIEAATQAYTDAAKTLGNDW